MRHMPGTTMSLPVKALNVLATFKKEMLAGNAIQLEEDELLPKKKEHKTQQRKTYRGSNSAVQRAFRRKDFWTPVF